MSDNEVTEEVKMKKLAGRSVFALFIAGIVLGTMLGVLAYRTGEKWVQKRVVSADAQAALVVTNINQQLAAINQQLNVSYAAYTELAKTAQSIDVAQATELAVLGRVMSDYFGKEKWARMVNKSREGMLSELKQAQEAQQRAAQNPK
jgi:apolipoprotein N-acyltransferase